MKEKKFKLQNKTLRRNLELMKSQLRATGELQTELQQGQSIQTKKSYRISENINPQISQKKYASNHEVLEINTAYLKRDLLKTFVLSALAFAAIIFIRIKNPF
jgi:hypothetical protein